MSGEDIVDAALLGPRFGIASVDRGRLQDDLSLRESYATEEEAYAVAEEHCTAIAGSEVALQPGEGYWIFEIRPVRFVGRR